MPAPYHSALDNQTTELLKQGSRGPAVKELTQILEEFGHLDSVVAVFNREVHRAVEEFQAQNLDPRGRPLVADGVVGALTWWALRNPGVNRASSDFSLPMPSHGGSQRGRHALQMALDEIEQGARELHGNNQGTFIDKYLNGIAPAPLPWCAAFVSWCFHQHPDGAPFKYSLGARDIRNQFRRKGWAFDVGDDLPQPGDIVAWWRGQPNGTKGHIGLVYKVENGVLFTIEGNKGGFPAKVTQFDYVLSRMDRFLGFGRVPD